MLTRGGVARYGGTRTASLAGGLLETVFSILLAPVVALPGDAVPRRPPVRARSVMWSGQNRDAYRPRTGAMRLRGLLAADAVRRGPDGADRLTSDTPATIWWALPMVSGLLLSIPFAVLTASPALGRCPRPGPPLRRARGMVAARGARGADGGASAQAFRPSGTRSPPRAA